MRINVNSRQLEHLLGLIFESGWHARDKNQLYEEAREFAVLDFLHLIAGQHPDMSDDGGPLEISSDPPEWVIRTAIETAMRVEAETKPAPKDSLVEGYKRDYPHLFKDGEYVPAS